MQSHNVISVTKTDAAAVEAALTKLKRASRKDSRLALLTLNEDWAIARFGPTVKERNVALLFIMDRATSPAVWANIHHHLKDVQPVVDRSLQVFEEFVAKSPNAVAVEWASQAYNHLRSRINGGWKPPFVVEVVVVPDVVEAAAPVTPAAIIDEPVPEKLPAKKKVTKAKPATTTKPVVEAKVKPAPKKKATKPKPQAVAAETPSSGRGRRGYVSLGDLQQEQPTA